ncbi:MAG: acyl-CoA thioesterase [SAR324 cluster bacterium]|nr:acyl-CoA thioesterase [SAR324 cluster bacterium]
MFIEKIQPRFSETNAAGHIGFVALPAWFEKGIESVYRMFVPNLAPQEWTLIVVKFELECLVEIHHTEEVTIETMVKSIGNSSFSLVQTLNQAGNLSARAGTTLVYFDYQEKKALPIPDDLRKKLVLHLFHEKKET